MKTLLTALLTAFYISAANHEDGDRIHAGSQLIRAFPRTDSQVRFLIGLYNSGKYDFWSTKNDIGIPVEILATRWLVPGLKEALNVSKIDYDVIITDMYKALKIKRIENKNEIKTPGAGIMNWKSYQRYNVIINWTESLAKKYPGLVTVEDVGKSYEGRPMKMVKVSTGGKGKPVIFSDAGSHAREWIASATLTYIMNELLSKRAVYKNVLDKVDFYFMPNINPDGYEFSMKKDRLWRKTRSPTKNSKCVGVDLNRNYDIKWMMIGASSDPCTEIFAGPKPFSEIEAVNVKNQLLKYANNTYVYLTFHSYGQKMMYPWGYTKKLAPDWKNSDKLGRSATKALRTVYGTIYEVGSCGRIMYPSSGNSDDYAKAVAGIKYVYAIELRPNKKIPGFELLPNEIIPTGKETFALFKNVMNFVRDKYKIK